MVDRTLYISGQLGLNPHTMEIVEGGVEEETIQALKNMHMILRRAQSDFSDVIKTTILLKDMKDFQVGSKNKQGPSGTNIIFRSMAPLYPLGLDENGAGANLYLGWQSNRKNRLNRFSEKSKKSIFFQPIFSIFSIC